MIARPPLHLADDTGSYGSCRQKSVHNAYDRDEPIAQQLARHRFRSVEIDIHTGKLGLPTRPGDWYVYHVDFPGFDGTSCRTLSDCLRQIDAFHLDDPRHEVLTVFVDLKDDLAGPHHDAPRLDARIRASFAPDALLEPGDLVARCPGATSLHDAVAGRCTWPSLGELRGKIVVVLTGGDLCGARSRLGAYTSGGQATRRAAFVAPNVRESCSFEAQRAPGDAIFFNLARGAFHEAPAIARAGLVTRAYQGGMEGGLDDPAVWAEATAAGINILATDRIDADRHPWTDVVIAPAAPPTAERAKPAP